MFKNLTTLALILGLTFSVNAQIKTPAPSPGAKIEQTVGLTNVSIEYSRPAMRGRTIFGNLVPYGKLWRTGANARTKITFSDDVTIDGKELKAGTYGILSVPNSTSWDVIFYTDSNGGGAPNELDESKVALRTTASTHSIANDKQSFTIGLSDLTSDSANLYFAWEKTKVKLALGVPTDKTTQASIDNVMSGPSSNDYFQAAVYYLESGKDISKAKEWIDKAVDMREEPAFWQIRQQSLIYAKLGDKKGAIKAAKKSLELATEAGNADYVKLNKDSIEEWSN
ncbi:DUF2911 domain-containing protein [Urechidicola croceus]|uniref:Dihydrolipoamide dehydrogenase n=1 Tax=Urechidicola croceus TaxID=1850246 RepID=A0A1D8P664_9FLAO|nr:DUF2911 domain-containing protein [Urechidicola croceus]AOW20056.1 dihydrolipoamide dehydrogenase [Urechidicola croceus]